MERFKTREEWLEAAVEVLRPRFVPTGAKLPEKVRVSIGFPDKGGLSKRRTLGVCWSAETSTDKIPQIYLNPTIETADGRQGYLATLVHELIHACGIHGHKKEFKRVGEALGLEGKMSCSTANDELQRVFEKVIEQLGTFPHATLIPGIRLSKPDKCRIHKCECPTCGYTVRVAKKWIEIANPMCLVCDIELKKEEK